MTDSPDPRIALMQKWSLENPSLMAQAGLVAQAASMTRNEPSNQHSLDAGGNFGTEFLGRKNGKKKLTKAEKAMRKLTWASGGKVVNGQHMLPAAHAHGPGYPLVHPQYQAAWGHSVPPAGFVHVHTPHAQTHANKQNHHAKKSKTDLEAELKKNLEEYKQMLIQQKQHIMTVVAAMDVELKDKFVQIVHNSYSSLESALSNSVEATNFSRNLNYINTEILNKLKSDTSLHFINYNPIKETDFEHIPQDFAKTYGNGYLIKEVLNIAGRLAVASSGIASLKTKTWYSHLNAVSTMLRKKRDHVENILRALKRATPSTTSAAQTQKKPVYKTGMDGVRKVIESEAMFGTDTVFMSNPHHVQ